MANEEQVAILKSGWKVWNEWREGHTYIKPDLTYADFRDIDLSGQLNPFGVQGWLWMRGKRTLETPIRDHFETLNLTKADLSFADFRGAGLARADLRGAHLASAHFTLADLGEANLTGTMLHEVVFTGAHLAQADLSGVIAVRAIFKGAALLGARLGGADLTSANLEAANLSGCNLKRANLSRADLTRADLSGADLSEATFYGMTLKAAHLSHTKLAGANLQRASLLEANLRQTDLSGAKLDGAKLGSTIFAGVNLYLAMGLESVEHLGPSTIGIDTLYRSKGNIPEIFLRGAGIPEPIITNMKALIGAMDAIQFYSCFISYRHEDKPFAPRLYDTLQGRGSQ